MPQAPGRRLTLSVAASLAVVLGAFTAQAGRTPVLPERPHNYAAIELPAHLRAPQVQRTDNAPADNPITDAGATLGRVLFYDTRLSANETRSCASCHRQESGFSDPERLSVGFEGGRTARNSMGLAFSRYYEPGRFFWDERAATLEEQALLPIQDAVEMGLTLDEMAARLEGTAFYGELFADAFGTAEVTSERVARALSQFVRSIVAPNSRYDAARAAAPGPPGRPLPGLTAQENRGLQVFFGPGRCAQCHAGDLFATDEPLNNGLDASTAADEGAGRGRFKSSSLRNVGLTAPYMHDGRFETLDEVVQFYSTGIQDHPFLDRRLRGDRGPVRLDLSRQDRDALVAFLHTLTDETLATDERWSDPFEAATATPSAPPVPAAALELAGPNPARGETAFRLSLGAPAAARVDVFALDGRRVAALYDGTTDAETVRWRTGGVAPGLYLVRLQAGAESAVVRVSVVR